MPLLEASIADLQVAAEAFHGNHLQGRRKNTREAQMFDIRPVILREPVPFGDDLTATGIISRGIDLRKNDERRARVEVRAALKLSNGTILYAAVPVEGFSATAILEVQKAESASLETDKPPLYVGSRRVASVGEMGFIAWPLMRDKPAIQIERSLPPSVVVDYAQRLEGLFRRLNEEMSAERNRLPERRAYPPVANPLA